MAVLINFKICDNAKECGGIAVCKPGALSWDEKNKTIKIDNSKCTSCELCEDACPVDAIKVAKNCDDYEKFKKRIEEDPRKRTDLFVDRYGAQPIHPGFLINEDKFEEEILKSEKLIAAEIFNDKSIMCLLNSIVIRNLFRNFDNIDYRKIKLDGESILKKYKIKKIPALLFFKNGEIIGKIEGYYDESKKAFIQKKIKKILFEMYVNENDVIIKKSKISGKGVFANRNFKKGEIVIKYHFKEISKEEFDNLPLKEKRDYTVFKDGKYFVSSPPERYVNHSCDANTYPKDNCDVANRDIKKGEEITGDYTKDSVPGLNMKCNCKSRNCKGIIKS